jgi:hypothetical protein
MSSEFLGTGRRRAVDLFHANLITATSRSNRKIMRNSPVLLLLVNGSPHQVEWVSPPETYKESSVGPNAIHTGFVENGGVRY